MPFHKKKYYWLDKLIFKNLSKKVWENAKAVIANSNGLKDSAQQTNKNQEIGVICNGVDTEKFHPNNNKLENKKIRLVYVGRLAPEKGNNYLIEAIAGLDNIELTLIGSGPSENDLKALAKETKVNVNFTGRLEQEDVIKELQKSDIYVMASLKEGMSNSVLEAMACGLPIIATDAGGSVELIKDNGFIIEKASSEAIANKLKKFSSNPRLISSMGLISRELAEKMSWKNVADEYFKIYIK